MPNFLSNCQDQTELCCLGLFEKFILHIEDELEAQYKISKIQTYMYVRHEKKRITS